MPHIASTAASRAVLAAIAATFVASAPPTARAGPHDAHAAHRHESAAPARSTVNLNVPHALLVRHDGRTVDFAVELDDARPVFLNFVYTTCTAICLPMSQLFAEFQSKLGTEREHVHMVSVSIDPEQDTPKRLQEYAKRFGAGAQWAFYTGTVEQSIAVQKAFGVYRGDKMSHTPLTLVRAAPGEPWVRIEGFATSDQLLQEYRRLLASR